MEPQTTDRSPAPPAWNTLLAAQSATFLVASGLHAGLQIPLVFVTLQEPPIAQAMIVEAAIGIGLAIAAFGSIRGRRWAESVTAAAILFGLAGVLVGVTALALGAAPSTELNTWYHRLMLVLLAGELLYVLVRGGDVRLTRASGSEGEPVRHG